MTRALLDTNLLVYQYDTREPEKALQAKKALDSLAHFDAGFISTQILCELYNALTRSIPGKLSRAHARHASHVARTTWPMLLVDDEIAWGAVQAACEYQLSVWDAQLLSTASSNGIPFILSEDFEHGRLYGDVVTIDPFVDGWMGMVGLPEG